jgi:ribonuclease PH
MAAARVGRAADEMRLVRIETGVAAFAEGSALIAFGNTEVRCTASIENRVPPFLVGKGQGWVTAEYSMLPRATFTRTPRESVTGRIGGRTHEIQRLIGRSLRAVTDLKALGERSITVDCDVLQADAGTRTAAITGGYVALVLALRTLVDGKTLLRAPVRSPVAAVSVGIVRGEPCLDLEYTEDSAADVDANVVMTGAGQFVEVQMTAEHDTFGPDALNAMLALAQKGITDLFAHQRRALDAAAHR